MAKTVSNLEGKVEESLRNADGKLDLTLLKGADYPVTIKLSKPVVIGDTSTKSITIPGEPTADFAFFMSDCDAKPGSAMAMAIERWLGIDEKIIRNLSMSDFFPLSAYLQNFL